MPWCSWSQTVLENVHSVNFIKNMSQCLGSIIGLDEHWMWHSQRAWFRQIDPRLGTCKVRDWIYENIRCCTRFYDCSGLTRLLTRRTIQILYTWSTGTSNFVDSCSLVYIFIQIIFLLKNILMDDYILNKSCHSFSTPIWRLFRSPVCLNPALSTLFVMWQNKNVVCWNAEICLCRSWNITVNVSVSLEC